MDERCTRASIYCITPTQRSLAQCWRGFVKTIKSPPVPLLGRWSTRCDPAWHIEK